jgi:L-fucose isomerase-like protein
VRHDRSSIPLVCLPIGRGWTPEVRGQFDELTTRLPQRIRIEAMDPVATETDILDLVGRIRAGNPAAILLPALHGGSARALLLAARKAGVPAIVWCHDERYSLASSFLAMEAIRQLDHPCALVHGSDPAASAELAAAAAAAGALWALAGARIGQVGPLHPNLVPCEANPLVIQKRFGSWVVPLPIAEVRRRAAAVERGRLEAAVTELRHRYTVHADPDSLERAVALHLALKELADLHRLTAMAVDCWSEMLPDFGVAPCLGFAFDSYRIACERDLALALTLIAGEALSGGPGYAGDLYSLSESNGMAVSTHCSACAALHSRPEPMTLVSEAPPPTVSGQGVVLSCHPILPRGKATMVMIHGFELDNVHLRACEIVETEFPQQMRVHIRIDGDLASFRAQAAGNHYVVFPGDSTAAWRTLAQWLHLAMH